jgi:hypothetical protein
MSAARKIRAGRNALRKQFLNAIRTAPTKKIWVGILPARASEKPMPEKKSGKMMKRILTLNVIIDYPDFQGAAQEGSQAMRGNTVRESRVFTAPALADNAADCTPSDTKIPDDRHRIVILPFPGFGIQVSKDDMNVWTKQSRRKTIKNRI